MAKRTADMNETQTSRKAGVTSSAKKMDSTRHGFDAEPPSRKAAGAYGMEERERPKSSPRGTAASRGKRAAVRKMSAARRRG